MSTRRRAAFGAIAVLGLVLWPSAAGASAQSLGQPRLAVLALLPPSSFEQAMGVPELRDLIGDGGAGLMTTRVGSGDPDQAAIRALQTGQISGPGEGTDLSAVLSPAVVVCTVAFSPTTPACGQGGSALVILDARAMSLGGASATLTSLAGSLGGQPGLVLALAPRPSEDMVRSGDEVTPLILARNPAATPVPGDESSIRSLTSDTTREDGLVSNVDVAPTILRFFGVSVPGDMDGEPIRITNGAAPFALHRLHLEQRRTRLPVQFAELAFVVAAAALGTGALMKLRRGGQLSPLARSIVRTVCFAGVSLLPALLIAGSLPHRSYPWTAPGVLLAMSLLTLLAVRESGSDSVWPFTVLGAIGLAFLAVNLSIQGPALRVPLFGGTMFDGVRFYGLPNGFFTVLLASALFVAAAMTPFSGFVLLIAAGLAAGFPRLGADVGGSVTLFAAAGLWLILRTHRRIRLPELGFIGGLTGLGLVTVLLANRWLPGAPTHAAKFVERGGGIQSVVRVVGDHLAIGARMIAAVPAAALPLAGFILIVVLVARRIGPVGAGMGVDDRWPILVITVCVASLMAYLANDTGAAAADPALVYAMAGITYPAMVAAGSRRAAAPPHTASDVTKVPG
jgi:hypothetical protein